MRLNALFTLVFVCCLGAAAQGRSEFILSETLTGDELYNDPRVTFPTRTPELQGTSLLFGTGSVFAEKLLELTLFPKNSLNSTDPVIVHIFANFTVQQSTWPTYPTDHDPGIGVGDGTLFGGFLAGGVTAIPPSGRGVIEGRLFSLDAVLDEVVPFAV